MRDHGSSTDADISLDMTAGVKISVAEKQKTKNLCLIKRIPTLAERSLTEVH